MYAVTVARRATGTPLMVRGNCEPFIEDCPPEWNLSKDEAWKRLDEHASRLHEAGASFAISIWRTDDITLRERVAQVNG